MKWFNNIRISIKITAACLILIFIIVGISVEGLVMLSQSSRAFSSFFDERFMASNDLNDIMKDVLQIRLNMVEQLLNAQNGDVKEAAARWEHSLQLRNEYLKIWERYKGSGRTDEEKKLILEWENARSKLADKTNGFAAAVTDKKFDEANSWLEQWVELYRPWYDLTGVLIALQKETGQKAKIVEDESAAFSRRLTILTLGIAIFAGIIITIVLTKTVTGPVNKGLIFANKIADGDFTDRLDLDQKDELGKLASALNRAADQLEKMVSDILSGSRNLTQAVQEISAGNENLSQRTTEQASSLEEVASTIEETTAVIGQTADNSAKADSLVSQTSNLAELGGSVVYQAVDAINEINDSSKKISEIISVIDDIAFQTNLLALNAAVEAARAGEQGRGFAVVAGEVRNLAQRSGSAAKEISSLIKTTIEKVEKGTSLANKSGEALKEIISSINNVAALVSEIKVSTDEQKQGAMQINTAISELDSMTQQNAGLVEETASASEEMSNQAQEFMSMMERFKIRDEFRV